MPRLPRGRHGLAREFVVRNQRDRLTAGIIAAVAEHGYHEATVSQICAGAGVSRRTFYTYFSSKGECYVEAFDRIIDFLTEAMAEASDDERGWPERVRSRFATLLDIFAANPNLARFVLIVPPRAGDGVAEHQRLALARVLEGLARGRPRTGIRKTPAAVEQTLLGGSMSLIAHKVEKGEEDTLAEVLPDLVELFLTPFIGRDEAMRIARGV